MKRIAAVKDGEMVLVKRVIVITGLLLGLMAPPARADDTIEYRVPFLIISTNGCVTPFETFQGTGFFHVKVHMSVGADGSTHASTEFNVESAQATAVIPPFARYVETAETSTSSNAASDTVPREETREDHVSFIRLGETGTYVFGDDLYQKVLAHMTVNANGQTTVDRAEIIFECH